MTVSTDLSLHLVTAEGLPTDTLCAIVDAAVDGGVTIVQVREKTASARELIERTVRVSETVAGRAAVLVDDRVDVVLAARDRGARVDGVHLGQSDLPVEVARRLLGAESVIGLTANTVEHLTVAAALRAGTVDYLGVGVIRPTATKPDHPKPLGVDGFAALAARTDIPCVAIGGVRPDDAADLRAAGAAGVAVVSAICGASDPRGAARAFREAMSR